VTIARTFTDSFAGIARSDVPGFLLAQGAAVLVAVRCSRGCSGAIQGLRIESGQDGTHVMISVSLQILIFQGLGELVTHFLLP